MTRKDFLKNIGIGAAFVLTVPCLHSCGSDDDNPAGEMTPSAGPQNFTIDLTDTSEAGSLDRADGFTIKNKVVVARDINGVFVAASLVCSHEATEVMRYDSTSDSWFCSTHGAVFAVADGEPQNNVTDRNLRIYTVTQSGDILSVVG